MYATQTHTGVDPAPVFGPAEIGRWLREERLTSTQVDDYQNINCNGIDTEEQ